jgi:hypothetical protein
MEARVAEARCCTALAIAAERRAGKTNLPSLRATAAELRLALRGMESRLEEARQAHVAMLAAECADRARREMCEHERDTVRAEFERLEQAFRVRVKPPIVQWLGERPA